MAEVRHVLGKTVSPDDHLMEVGMDSRGGMELRRALGESLGLSLPTSLLYDFQSVAAIAKYISEHVNASEAGNTSEDDMDFTLRAAGGQSRAVVEKPSELLKVLRYAPGRFF